MKNWLRLPGLFHRRELEQVIKADGHHEYLFEPAGTDGNGRELIAVYCRFYDNGSSSSALQVPSAPPPNTPPAPGAP